MPYAVEFQRHKNTFDIHDEQTPNCFYRHWITKILIAVNTYYSSQITFRECDNICPQLKIMKAFYITASGTDYILKQYTNIRRYTPLFDMLHTSSWWAHCSWKETLMQETSVLQPSGWLIEKRFQIRPTLLHRPEAESLHSCTSGARWHSTYKFIHLHCTISFF